MSFATEPPFQHGRPARTAVLLVNLGTPEAPTAAALRRYLAEFLWDPRVVEIPRPLWWLILHGVILRTRPAKSAAKYASIWRKDGGEGEGSPLLHWSRRQAQALQTALSNGGHELLVRCAMRYGTPSVADELDALKAAGATRILVLPLYPQYSATTTASVVDAVNAWSARQRHLPELRFVNRYHDEPGYIAALAASVREHWAREGRGQKLVMSFHGVPARTLQLGDPYHCECHATARRLGEALGLSRDDYVVTFQSRLGRAEWLQPYTEPTVQQLARDGIRHIDAICPGFACDNLETLEEIAMEAREAFVQAGGQRFGFIACLNDRPDWIAGLAGIALRHLQGWPLGPAQPDAAQRQRALALGATD